jgi:hypothetical protein
MRQLGIRNILSATVDSSANIPTRPGQVRRSRWSLTYLSVINLAGTEERIKGIVSWYEEAGKVDQEGTGDVEEDQEEV